MLACLSFSLGYLLRCVNLLLLLLLLLLLSLLLLLTFIQYMKLVKKL